MNSSTLLIDEALSKCIYDPLIQSELSQYLKAYYSDSQSYHFYLYSSPTKKHKIIVMKAKLIITPHSQIDSINIMIYFIKGYPDKPPLLYIEQQPNTSISPLASFYINTTTYQIEYYMFYNWKKTYNSLRELLAEISKLFNNNCPLIQIENKQNDVIKKKQSLPLIEVFLFDKNKERDEQEDQIEKESKEYNEKEEVKKNTRNKEVIENEDIIVINRTITYQNYHKRMSSEANDLLLKRPKIKRRSFNGKKDNNNDADDINVKEALINEIIQKTKDKVLAKTTSSHHTSLRIKSYLSYLNERINKKNVLINNEKEIMDVLHKSDTELASYQFAEIKLNQDLSNIDEVLTIKNKPLLKHISHVHSIEDYLLLIKQYFKNNNITLDQALIEYRRSSCLIFKLNYKIYQISSCFNQDSIRVNDNNDYNSKYK